MVAELSKACAVFARTKADIVGWNPIQGMDILYFCTDRSVATG
jgi:hypothetical protein